MTRYIDADKITYTPSVPIAVISRIVNAGREEDAKGLLHVSRAEIEAQPTIDAVPKEKILLFLNIAKKELSKAHADKSVNGIVTWSASVTTLEGLLKEYDTADTDIVPVIRCKDCKYSTAYYHGENSKLGMFTYRCINMQCHVKADGYCSDAERKETS